MTDTKDLAELEALIDRAIAKGALDSYELESLAQDEPERLAPYLPRLLAADIAYPTEMYRAAGSEIQRALVAKVDAGGGDLDKLLLALARTRGPVPEAAFRRWRDQPPPGAEGLCIGPADYMPEGGWMLDGDRVRELCGPIGYSLDPEEPEEELEEELEERPRGAAEEPPQGHCQGCGSTLWVALDLDTADARVAEALAHTGWSGRLRLVFCYACDIDAHPTFIEVGPDGSNRLTDPPQPGSRTPEMDEVPTVRLVPTDHAVRHPHNSAIGGHPRWRNDSKYPTCPRCAEVMTYIAQLDLGDLDAYDYGSCYFTVFLDAECGLAAMICQG